MRTVVSGQFSVFGWRTKISICLLIAACYQLSCTIPNLEKPECTAGRDVVKRFYSFHFGNDMSPSLEGLKVREKFLTNRLFQELSALSEQKRDYFTATDNYPKAFRVGECKAESQDRVTMQVVLLWKTETSSEQKEVQAEAVKTGDAWLINKVSN